MATSALATSRQAWWVYLLACRDGRTYAGIATDVLARFRVHQAGRGAKFTRSNPPVAILGMRRFDNMSEAMKAEHALKRLQPPAKLAWARDSEQPSALPPAVDQTTGK